MNKELKTMLMTEEVDHGGLSRCVIAFYPGLFRHSVELGWLKYNGRYWSGQGARSAVSRAVTNVLEKRRVIFATANEMKKASACRTWNSTIRHCMAVIADMDGIETNATAFDADFDSINCNNGVVNLQDGTLEAHQPGQLFTYCVPVDYNPDADPTMWLEFLTSCGLAFEIIDYLQMAIGYTLTGWTSEEIMFYIWGKTRSGKGTTTEILSTILGKLGAGVDMTTFTAKRTGDTNNFDLAPLKAKRFLAASETARHGQLNPAVIKKITGGDEIYCSFKRKSHFSFRPQFKIWLSSNFPVNIDVDDDAAWGRIRVINYPESFLGKEDKGLKKRLKSKANLEGVLLWAVLGAVAWYKVRDTGLDTPESIVTATKDHREALDSIQQFISSQCVIGDAYFTSGKQLYTAYRDWCNDEGYTAFGRKRFTQSLEKRGHPTKVKRIGAKTTRAYAGIGLLED